MKSKDNKEFHKEKKISEEGIIGAIRGAEKVVLLTHINPDGDALGSQSAMIDYCIGSGLEVSAFIPNGYPTNLEFINSRGMIREFEEASHRKIILGADLIIILDLNDSKRVDKIEPHLLESRAKKILIDHHLEPKDFCDHYYVDFKSASTGQLVYNILKSDSDYVINTDVATGLYTAIMTDTGSFRFSNTNAEVHRITAELLETGAKPTIIYDKVYNSFPLSAIKIKGKVYSNIELHKNDSVCLSYISREDFRITGAKEEETEGIVESLLAIGGVNIAILLIETPDRDEVRCSFRAKEKWQVREMAVYFEGGGHTQAAGARVKNRTLAETKATAIDYIKKHRFKI